MKADLVIKNGTAVTPENTFDRGVAIHDEKFVAIGTNDSLPESVEEIDANGKHILPGLIGPHYLLRQPSDMERVGPLLKMNPPVRTRTTAKRSGTAC